MSYYVQILCPEAKVFVASGEMLTPEDLESSALNDFTFGCPVCNKQHVRTRQNAVLLGYHPPKE